MVDITPTLFIGLGGTGMEVLTGVAQCCAEPATFFLPLFEAEFSRLVVRRRRGAGDGGCEGGGQPLDQEARGCRRRWTTAAWAR